MDSFSIVELYIKEKENVHAALELVEVGETDQDYSRSKSLMVPS